MFQGLQKWPETEEFSKLIATMSNVRIGKILNYTEAAVRKKTKKARNLKVFHFTYSRNPFSQGIGLCYLKQLPSLEAWRSQMGSEAKWGQEAKWRSQMGSEAKWGQSIKIKSGISLGRVNCAGSAFC